MLEDLTATIPTMPIAPAADGGATGGATPPAFLDSIQPEYKEAIWAQNFAKAENPYHELAKAYANAESLVGKKSAGLEIPGADAPPEAVKAFHKALGVPEDVKGYEYAGIDVTKEPESVQKVLGEMSKDTAFMDAMKAEALAAGVTPAQFNKLAAAFDGNRLEQVKAMVAGAEAANTAAIAQQTEQFGKIFGNRADAVKRTATDLIAKVVPQSARDSGDPAIQLFAALDFIQQKLYANDTVNPAGQTNVTGGEANADSIHAKILELRDKKDANGNAIYGNQFNPANAALSQEIDGLYERLAEAKNKKRE